MIQPRFNVLKSIFFGIVAVDLLIINLTLINLWVRMDNFDVISEVDSVEQVAVTITPTPVTGSGKSQLEDALLGEYKSYVDVKYQDLLSKVATLSAAKSKDVIYITPSVKKATGVSYFTIPGNGSTAQNDWVTLQGTDFYFNKSDFTGIKKVYLETNIRLFNGNGVAYFRLFDVTHGIGVQGSDVQTKSQSSELVVSGEVNFWEGSNLYRVQAKSLTADTAIFDSGKLKIITEN